MGKLIKLRECKIPLYLAFGIAIGLGFGLFVYMGCCWEVGLFIGLIPFGWSFLIALIAREVSRDLPNNPMLGLVYGSSVSLFFGLGSILYGRSFYGLFIGLIAVRYYKQVCTTKVFKRLPETSSGYKVLSSKRVKRIYHNNIQITPYPEVLKAIIEYKTVHTIIPDCYFPVFYSVLTS